MKDYLAFLGLVTFIMLVLFSLLLILTGVGELFSKAVWRYKYKHRFDKKPMAKCYCKDCVYFTSLDRRCTHHYTYAEESDFCNHARPCKKEIKE